MNRLKVILFRILALLGWLFLILAVLLTGQLARWILLAEVLVGGLTPSQPIPVILILAALVVVTGCLACRKKLEGSKWLYWCYW
jgi:hypothetical protein